MRTIFLAMLFVVAVGCGGSDPKRVLVESESSPEATEPGAVETGFEETSHYRELDKILLRMIGEDYRERNGEPLQRMDAARYFLGVTNIRPPQDDDPSIPEIEWRLVFPTEEPDDESFAGWSFVKGRWADAPDDESRYGYIALEFQTMASDLVTIAEMSELSGMSIALAETGNESPGGGVIRSEPLILESGYRCMVEFMRGPGSPNNRRPVFRQVVIKFAPVQTPRLAPKP